MGFQGTSRVGSNRTYGDVVPHRVEEVKMKGSKLFPQVPFLILVFGLPHMLVAFRYC